MDLEFGVRLVPQHGRTNHVLRMDAVLTENTRLTFKTIKDRDDDWLVNRITPGNREQSTRTRPASWCRPP